VVFFQVVEIGPSCLRVDQAVVKGLPSSDNVSETGACKLKSAHSDDNHQGEHDEALKVGVFGCVPVFKAGDVGEEQGEKKLGIASGK
jgi:hypothetical protein